MNTPREIIEFWKAKILNAPQLSAIPEGRFKLEISGEGGGAWILTCKNGATLSEGQGEADCTVIVSSDDFIKIANKELNPQAAFMEGKIKVEGDMLKALSFSSLF